MYKRLNRLINIFCGCLIGCFMGYAGYVYLDYKKRPLIYLVQSAPWYTGILLYGAMLAVILVVCVAVKIFIRRRLKREEEL